jgi:hypothetical protein
MGHDLPPRMTGRGRVLRGLWPDRNPLRRAVDRAEAVVMAGLLAAFLIGAPLVALAAGQQSYAAGLRIQHVQSAWHRVPAVLLAGASSQDYIGYEPLVLARWTTPSGAQRRGEVYAPSGARAGSTVMVWTDASGRLTGPPLRHEQVLGQAGLYALAAPAVLGLVLGGVGLLIHCRLDRRRLVAWDADWLATEPRWTSRH